MQASGGNRDVAPKVLIRCDSAFYGHPTIGPAIRAGVEVSVTVRLTSTIKCAIASIHDDAWTPIEYTDAFCDESTDTWIFTGGGRRDPVHRVRLAEEGPPDSRPAGRVPHPRPATAQGSEPG